MFTPKTNSSARKGSDTPRRGSDTPRRGSDAVKAKSGIMAGFVSDLMPIINYHNMSSYLTP